MSAETYWKNRRSGRRGQGETINPIVGYSRPEQIIQGKVGSRKARRLVAAHGEVRRQLLMEGR